jgi:hypothetical protein
VIAIGVLLFIAAAVPLLPVAIGLFAAIGAPVVGWMVSLQTLLQHATADGLRGRVLGAFGTGNMAFLLVGLGLGSGLGSIVDIVWLFVLAGALFVAAGVVAFTWLPRQLSRPSTQLEAAVA